MPEIGGISYNTTSLEKEAASTTDTVQGIYSIYQDVCRTNEEMHPHMYGAVWSAFDNATVNIEINLLQACKAFDQSAYVLTNLKQDFEKYEEELSVNAGGK